MFKALKRWRKTTNLSDGTFFKFYIYDRTLVRPRRKINRLRRRIKCL
jgi:hypothetical protein